MISTARSVRPRADITAVVRDRARSSGFTLIELMIVIVVVGILATIAYPQYTEFVQRSRIVDATSQLNDFRTRMEQFFQDNRSYLSLGNCGVVNPAGPNFTFGCNPIPGGYRIDADGISTKGMGLFQYRLEVDNAGVRRETRGAPAGWTKSTTCWTVRKSGDCS